MRAESLENKSRKAGWPGFVIVDVYDKEPIGRDELSIKMATVICTRHSGYAARERDEEDFAVVVDDIVSLAAGKPSPVLN